MKKDGGVDPHLAMNCHEVMCPNIGTINVYVQVSVKPSQNFNFQREEQFTFHHCHFNNPGMKKVVSTKET